MPDPVLLMPVAVLASVLNVALVIVGIGFLIFVHELGHFAVAKWCGVRVEAFSLGFGPVLLKFRRGDTEYRLSAIPLGGYVKMAGETPGDAHTEDPAEFQNKSIPARAAIMIAGVTMNGIIGILFFIIAFNAGVPLISPVVGAADPGQPAFKAGIRPGDRVLNINGRKILDFEDLISEIAFSDGPVDVVVQRGDETLTFEAIAPIKDEQSGFRRIGVRQSFERTLEITEDSPAHEAGLRSGDKLLTVAGLDATNQLALQLVLRYAEGAVPFRVDRDGDVLDIPLPPTFDSEPSDRLIIGVSQPVATVGVVYPDSGAEAAGFHVGDRFDAVNGTPVVTLEQALLAASAVAPATVTFTVTRNGNPLELAPVDGIADAPGWAAFFKGMIGTPVTGEGTLVSLVRDGQFIDGNPARQAGLLDGARILSVNGESVKTFQDINDHIADTQEGEPVVLVWSMPGNTGGTTSIMRAPTKVRKEPGLGLMVAYDSIQVPGIFAACKVGIRRSLVMSRRIIQMIGGIFTGKVSAKNLGGPVMIFQISSAAAQKDFFFFLYFLGILSINLAILNLLPIPILDGGHLLFILIEAIRGKPLSENSMALFQWAGLILLLMLMAFVIVNDITRL